MYFMKGLTQEIENGVWLMGFVFHTLNCTGFGDCQSIMNVTTMSDKLQVCRDSDAIERLPLFAS